MVEEIYGSDIKKPLVFGSTIFMEMGMDVTMKGMARMNMTEMCHYETKDGKIISERFYYWLVPNYSKIMQLITPAT